jgi:hypothetical protein
MNFVTEELANSLGIKQRRCSVPIGALDNLTTTAKRHITATITNKGGTYKRTVTFLVIPTISPLVPDQPVDRSGLKVPKNLQLPDLEFHKPSPIGILLSAGPTVSSFRTNKIRPSPQHRAVFTKDLFWLGHRGEPSRPIVCSLLSYNHGRSIKRSRSFLGTRGGTSHHISVGIGATM